MSNFNQKTKPQKGPNTKNLAGGSAYKQGSELELVSILLTSFAQDQYYRSADDTFARLRELIHQCDPKFVAQAAIYARTQFGMRSITHVAGAELASRASGHEWAKRFYDRVIFRPDDMTEMVAYYYANCAQSSTEAKKRHKKDITSAMKQGFANAFGRFTGYQLAKYRGENKGVKLVDLVNLVHPKPNEENKEAIALLMRGDLKSLETWEAKLSAAGQSEEDDVSKLKANVWAELIKEKKLGYLALLRNLRNIMEQAPKVLPQALESLTSPGFIKAPKSLIFPFQYLVAYKQFFDMGTRESRSICDALSNAMDISCENVKNLSHFQNEDTLVVVDNSGSMNSPVTKSEHMKKSELGALFGIVLAKAVNADLMEFASFARYINFSLKTDSMGFAADFHHLNQVSHGTDFDSIFLTAKKAYKRIMIFSDMQSWAHGLAGVYQGSFKSYKAKFKCDPFIYTFDLAGYGTMQFPADKVFALAGFSEKIFILMGALEKDRNAMVNEIKGVEF